MFGLKSKTSGTVEYLDKRMGTLEELIGDLVRHQAQGGSRNNLAVDELHKFALETTKALSAMSDTIKSMQLTIGNVLDIQECLVNSVEVKPSPRKTRTKSKKKVKK